MLAKAIILIADKHHGDKIYSAEELRAIAKKNPGLFEYHSRTLYAMVELDDPTQLENARRQAELLAKH